MENQILVSYSYRIGMIRGTEDFKNELKAYYHIHEKPRWMPAAGGNYEMWFNFFINSPIISFLSTAIVGGVIYDLTKHYILKPFWDSLQKLNDTNGGNLEILNYKFNFDDVTICVYGVFKNYISIFGAIFNEVYKQIPYLLKQEKTKNLYEIHMPVNEENGQTDTWEGPENPADYLRCWRLDTDYGLFRYLYFLHDRRILEI